MNLWSQFKNNIFIEKQNTIFLFPTILGFGILAGVYWPVNSWIQLFCILSLLLAISPIFKLSIIFSFGFYIANTGGLIHTTLLTQKVFLTQEVRKIAFFADIKQIEEYHPTMKNMSRIEINNIHFKNHPELQYIQTAKMTCSRKMIQNLHIGDRIKIFGQLNSFKDPVAPFSFNQKQFYTMNKLDAPGIIYHISKIRGGKTQNYFAHLRRTFTNRILNTFPQKTGGIVCALVTGDKTSILPEVREAFIKSGTAHILAISGLHMSLLATLVYYTLFWILLRLSNLSLNHINPHRFASILTILCTFGYLALSGFSPSAVRAFIMTSCVLVAKFFDRSALSLNNLALSAFVMLIADPFILFSISFQLSFSAVAALLAFYERFQQHISQIYHYYENILYKLLCYFVSSLITTTIANIATFPISAATFNRFSAFSFLGNIVAIPALTFGIVPMGLLLLLGGWHCDHAIHIFHRSLEILIDCLTHISQLPYTDLIIKSPRVETLYIILFGGILLCFLKTLVRLSGVVLILYGSIKWICEPAPICAASAGARVMCWRENDRLYFASAGRKGTKIIEEWKHSWGINGGVAKLPQCEWPSADMPDPLFIFPDGSRATLCSSSHPMCPVRYKVVPFDK